MKTRPIILVGGGSGGHIAPLLAIGEELISQKRQFIYVGDSAGKEAALVAEYGWEFVGLHTGKFRRYWGWQAVGQNIIDFGRFIRGVGESIALLIRTDARVIFSKGGYVALPMIIAAKLFGRKLITHESDVVMGLTNRLAARLADKILTAFPITVFPFRTDRFEQIGIPIRSALRQAATLKAPRKSRPLLFVLAGLQGSTAINRLIREALPALLPSLDVVHITGEAEALLHKNLAATIDKKMPGSYKTYPFITRELPYYYQTSDLIVTRASATVIAEAALFQKPVYLIPLPSAAGNHQVKNAQYLQAAGAAVMREERDLTSDKLISDIKRILADKTLRDNLGRRLDQYFNEGEATKRAVEIILNYDEKSS